MDLHRRALDLDEYLYTSVSHSGPYPFNVAISWLSSAANHSRVSLVAAGVMAAFGGPRGRRAAAVGVLAVASTSVVANLVVKKVVRRPRPLRPQHHYAHPPTGRSHVPMPTSTSFPSGHSAAAAALATAVAVEWPAVAVPFVTLAGLIAYSRVHTGVHYPLDVIGGIAVGVGMGLASSVAVRLAEWALHRSNAALVP